MFTSRYPEFAMFASLIASVGAVSLLLGHQSHEDSFLLYLPLPHILPVEYIVELVMIFFGGSCSYGRVNTLTDASSSLQIWLVYLQNGRALMLKLIQGVQSRKPFFNGVHPGSWAARR